MPPPTRLAGARELLHDVPMFHAMNIILNIKIFLSAAIFHFDGASFRLGAWRLGGIEGEGEGWEAFIP